MPKHDAGQKYTDKQLAALTKRINTIYTDAKNDMQAKLDEYTAKFQVKNKIHLQELADGKITKADYDSWMQGQVFQGKQWQAKRDQLAGVLFDANKEAAKILNGGTISVLAENANFMAYTLEHGAGVNFGFGLYDANTVTNLLKHNPKLLPHKDPSKIKDKKWNMQSFRNQITQGIIQGERLEQIADRLAKVTASKNGNLMLTHARTAMTSAQNAGRQIRLEDAKKMGIKLKKEWMATFDMHTRDAHRELDGQKVDVDKPFIVDTYKIRFPADPQAAPWLVYNCRCTLVADLDDYPEVYQRYDNIDGVPVDQMTYKEWYDAKMPKGVDYSEFGGKDMFQLFTKYKNLNEMLVHATGNELDIIADSDLMFNMSGDEVNKLFKKAQKINSKAAIPQPDDPVQVAKKGVDDAEQALKDFFKGEAISENQVFPNIWKNEVTWKDYAEKKGAIQAKRDYFEEQIAKAKAAGNLAAQQKFEILLESLNDFEKYGKQLEPMYSALETAKKGYKQAVKDAKGSVSPFSPEAYTQERKDMAVWAKTQRAADNALRDVSGEVWRDATMAEREAIYEYTSSFHKFNEPLRGIEYGTNEFKGVGKTDLNAGYTHNGKMLNDMTAIIERSTYDEDFWFQRGCGYSGMDKFFQCNSRLLTSGTQEELENELLGKTVTEYGFMSMGSAKGKGFDGDILMNIYAPSGTKMMYVEPFSAFGDGAGLSWDGIAKQSSFGYELETIMQQGTEFKITKITRASRYDTIYIDIEVVNQLEPQLWKGAK